ncbi:MAG: 2-haloacid dehalogenase [Gammaproteobacteria bacterium]|jgi:2-haloacid dehalogenase
MTTTLAFDIYGTLIDTQGISQKLYDVIGDQSIEFAHRWREKQLEYTFRRGLMRCYQNFSTCTAQALDYTNQLFATNISPTDKKALMGAYETLPAFADVTESLILAEKAGFRLFAFSNGSESAVEKLLQNAGIRSYFEGVISVDSLKTFKPNPDVYQYFLDTTNSQAENSWLVSSNPFDVIGAISVGMKAAWLQRNVNALFDPWEFTPTVTVKHLSQLPELILP